VVNSFEMNVKKNGRCIYSKNKVLSKKDFFLEGGLAGFKKKKLKWRLKPVLGSAAGTFFLKVGLANYFKALASFVWEQSPEPEHGTMDMLPGNQVNRSKDRFTLSKISLYTYTTRIILI